MLTHFVVEPVHLRGTGHLVPIALVDATATGADGVRLALAKDEVRDLPAVDVDDLE